jgi:hypothetical protein
MRALCGAIIAAGSLIGLGLAAIGLGSRYTALTERAADGSVHWANMVIKFQDLDNPMKLILVLLVIGVAVGIATAFLGLMYHHHRRHNELLHHQQSGTQPRVTV